ncbi:DsbA family protein, partial [Aeromicrobium sp. Leaf272]
LADPLVLSSRAALVGLDLETADALLASDEYADAVRTQDETARSLGVTQLPYVVVENRWTLAGTQSQDDYVQALH